MRKELAGNSKHRNVAEIDTHYLQRIITIMHGCEVCALLSLSLVILHFLGLANNSAKGSLLLGAERETCVSFCSFKVKFAESMLKFCFALQELRVQIIRAKRKISKINIKISEYLLKCGHVYDQPTLHGKSKIPVKIPSQMCIIRMYVKCLQHSMRLFGFIHTTLFYLFHLQCNALQIISVSDCERARTLSSSTCLLQLLNWRARAAYNEEEDVHQMK